VWISATKDISSAVDTNSGSVEVSATTPGGASVAARTRTSSDSSTWDAWTAVNVDNSIASTHHDYIQLAVIGSVSGSDEPTIQDATLSYDGTPSATELATGFTAGSQFYFGTLLSTLVIANKLDAPQKWTGSGSTAALGGTPPHIQFLQAHKNYMFGANTSANPSRLYFSDVLDLETWPALNYIDIAPDDGDWITGLLTTGDYLIITKQRSVWYLLGDGPSTFEVRRAHSNIGCVAPRSLTMVNDFICFVSHDGIYFTDLHKPVLMTERIKTTWKTLNRRKLNLAASAFYDHLVRIDVPSGSSTQNDLRIIIDTIRNALYLIEFTKHASCYTKFMEAGQEILLYGHADEGQVSQADDGNTDGGSAIPFTWESKHFNFGSSAIRKKAGKMYLSVVPASSNVDLTVTFIVDGVEMPSTHTETITGDSDAPVVTYRIKPRDYDVRHFRTLGYKITQSTTNGGVKIHELVQEYLQKGVKES